MARILIFERESASVELLLIALRQTGHELHHTADYRAALASSGALIPDLIIAVAHADLSQALPLLEDARGLASPPPVIILGERHYDLAVTAFRAGAADYLHMPCSPAHLEAVVTAALTRQTEARRYTGSLRRLQRQLSSMQALLADLEGDGQGGSAELSDERDEARIVVSVGHDRRYVLVDGQAIAVTPIEYRLLHCLSATPGEPVSFRRLVAATHAYDAPETEAASILKSHVRNLRRKLPAGSLITVRGSGLMLCAAADAPAKAGGGALEAA